MGRDGVDHTIGGAGHQQSHGEGPDDDSAAGARAAGPAGPGDHLLYEFDDGDAAGGGVVRLRRLAPADVAYLRAVQATLGEEWDSPEDDAAYAGL